MNLNNIFDAINILKVGILLLIVAASFAVARSSMILIHPELATAITLDLTLTLPLTYLFIKGPCVPLMPSVERLYLIE